MLDRYTEHGRFIRGASQQIDGVASADRSMWHERYRERAQERDRLIERDRQVD